MIIRRLLSSALIVLCLSAFADAGPSITRHIKSQPACGELYQDGDGIKNAVSSTITKGTADAGTYADTVTVNQTYMQIGEVADTPGIDVELNFTLANNPGHLEIVGRYQGNPAHEIQIYAWDYNDSDWDSFTGAAADMDHSAIDLSYEFDYDDLEGALVDYVSGTDSKIRFLHADAGTNSHDLYLDRVAVIEKQFVITSGGTYQAATGFTEGVSSGVTLDAANGTMTIDMPGMYRVVAAVSFIGTPSETFSGHIFVDGVKEDKIGLERKLGQSGDVGSASFTGIIDADGGEVLTVRFTSILTGSFATIQNINWNITRE